MIKDIETTGHGSVLFMDDLPQDHTASRPLNGSLGTDDVAGHCPVLAPEVVELLDPQPGMVCLDCTVGRGGHASLIAARLSPNGRYVGLDMDPANVAFASQRLASEPGARGVMLDLVHANFRHATEVLDRLGIDRVDLLLADLGFSSNQMFNPGRGLSFLLDGPLDMRLDPGLPTSAQQLVNRLKENELADLIYHHSGERRSRRIARKIVEYRQQSPIKTTKELAQVVRRAVRPRGGRRHAKSCAPAVTQIDPATRTFMALRIAVNEELESLDRLLGQVENLLRPGGRAAVISFHSLEDRRVKRAFAAMHRQGRAQRITTKPRVAGRDERRANPKSRSAKLRVIQRTVDAADENDENVDIINTGLSP